MNYVKHLPSSLDTQLKFLTDRSAALSDEEIRHYNQKEKENENLLPNSVYCK